MTRKRFQRGYVRLRGKRDPYWEGQYWEDLRSADGRVIRKHKAKNLGRLADLPTKRLALRKLAAIVTELNDPEHQPRSVVTVRDFVEGEYVKLVLPTKKKLTQESYLYNLREHILPAFGDHVLSETTAQDAQAFINEKASGGLAWNTVRNLRSILSAVFQAAVRFRHRTSNPIHLVALPPRPPQRLPALPNERDFERLEAALPEPYRTMVWLTRITGLRAGEVSALRWGDIDLQGGCLYVREAFHEGHFHSPKSRCSDRPLDLDERAVRRLAAFKRLVGEPADDAWVFANCRGTLPIRTHNVLTRWLQPLARKLGLPRVTWHLLRHWNSTVMHEEGVPLKVAQHRLGHARAETTMTHYTHLRSAAARKAARAIARRVSSPELGKLWPNFVGKFVGKSAETSAGVG